MYIPSALLAMGSFQGTRDRIAEDCSLASVMDYKSGFSTLALVSTQGGVDKSAIAETVIFHHDRKQAGASCTNTVFIDR